MLVRLRYRLFIIYMVVIFPFVLALAHLFDSDFWGDLQYGAANLWKAFKKGGPLD